MIVTPSSIMECEGDVGMSRGNRRGSVQLKKGKIVIKRECNDFWTCTVLIHNDKQLKKVPLSSQSLCIPRDIETCCRKGILLVPFSDGSTLEFKCRFGKRDTLVEIGKLLTSIKYRNILMAERFGTTVHDLSDGIMFNRFGGERLASNNQTLNCANNLSGGERYLRNGHGDFKRSFGGHANNIVRPFQHRARNPSNFYGSSYRGHGRRDSSRQNYRYESSFQSYNHDRGRAGYGQSFGKQYGDSGYRNSNPHKQAPRNHPYNQQPLKDRGSADNSLDRKNTEWECKKEESRSDQCGDRSPSRRPVIPKPTLQESPSASVVQFYGKNRSFSAENSPRTLPSSVKPFSKRPGVLLSPCSTKKCKIENESGKENRCNNRSLSALGFVNLGNSCYMNAVIQAMFSIEPFANDLVQMYTSWKEALPEKSVCKSLCELLMERNDPMSSYAQEKYKTLLSNLKSSVDSYCSAFKGYDMQDAHEFVIQLLDKVKDEVDQIKTSSNVDFVNPVRKAFEFHVLETRTCNSCSNTSCTTQVLYDVGLHVPKQKKIDKTRSVQFVLDSNFKSEKIECRCEKCNHNESTVSRKISRFPRVLSIHLKRYMLGNHCGIKKNDTPVRVSEYLTLHKQAAQQSSCHSSNGTSSATERNASESSKKVDLDPIIHEFKEISCLPSLTAAASDAEAMVGLYGGEGPVESNILEPKGREKQPEIPATDVTSEVQINDGWGDVDWSNFPLPEPVEEEEDDEDLKKAKILSLQDMQNTNTGADENDEESEEEMEENEEEQSLIEDHCRKGNMAHSYCLTSVVIHTGMMEKGHYMCNAYDFGKKVYRKYDDTAVSELTKEAFFQEAKENGYLLLYTEKEICDHLEELQSV